MRTLPKNPAHQPQENFATVDPRRVNTAFRESFDADLSAITDGIAPPD
jgi:hypothetical protein